MGYCASEAASMLKPSQESRSTSRSHSVYNVLSLGVQSRQAIKRLQQGLGNDDAFFAALSTLVYLEDEVLERYTVVPYLGASVLPSPNSPL